MFTRLARSNSSDSKSLNNLNTIDEESDESHLENNSSEDEHLKSSYS